MSNKNYAEIVNKNKEKIIKKEVKEFKKCCIKKFEEDIKKGLSTTIVDFAFKVTHKFQNEISELVITQLSEEYKNIEFSFVYRHYMNSYKGLKMIVRGVK